MLFFKDKSEDKAMEKRAKSIKSPTPPLARLESAGDKKGEARVKKAKVK